MTELSEDEIRVISLAHRIDQVLLNEDDRVKLAAALSFLRACLVMCARDYEEECADEVFSWATSRLNEDYELFKNGKLMDIKMVKF